MKPGLNPYFKVKPGLANFRFRYSEAPNEGIDVACVFSFNLNYLDFFFKKAYLAWSQQNKKQIISEIC